MGYIRRRFPLLLVWTALVIFASDARAVIELQIIAGGLAAPDYITSAGDGTDRLFVVEQGGSIRRVLYEPNGLA